MQTFLPYPDFRQSLEALDTRRLGKQRVEARQLIDALEGAILPNGRTSRWINHPACKMWRGYTNALRSYYNTALEVFQKRGGNNVILQVLQVPTGVTLPPWLGWDFFHRTHRAQLLRKANENPTRYLSWYSKFGWLEKPGEFDYIWPIPSKTNSEILTYTLTGSPDRELIYVKAN